MGDRISITGYGIVCAIGTDAEEVLNSLQSGESGIGRMRYLNSRHSELPVGEVRMSNDDMKAALGIDSGRMVSRTSLMGALAVREAVSRIGQERFTGRRAVLISGTTVGNMDINESSPLPVSNECGRSTEEIAEMSGLEDVGTCTISTACSSALNSIILGAEMLRRNEADIVVAGGSEALSVFHLNGFNTLMILDRERCRPFDGTRAGLNLGEGAAYVIMERNADDAAAYVSGYGNRCDAFHQTASSPDGEGAFLAMSDALSMSGLSPDAIDYVNAHGTGTVNNDDSESQALKRVFPDCLPEISSTKSFTGHTTSASGSIETVICILAMQHGFTPASLGWSVPSENCIVPTMGHSGVRLNHVMCNSFGFGGNDSSIILSRSADDAAVLPALEDLYDVCCTADEKVTSREELAGLKEFISPMESRRMGKLMKAAHLSSLRALKAAGIERPDAIVTATSRGMFEISRQFLSDIHTGGEELLKPTLFMQSTHNTIGSALAIRTGCHGYNITYSHGEDSMKWAVRDAERLIRTGQAVSVLVGSYDESTPDFSAFSERGGAEAPAEIYAESIVLTRVIN
ncbi:MAG: beta-ketoacyl synthase chain length factor [Bacteroidaceae bacterium]|nr:beta-ketoacyl synthase chain length factor [Bacteroidaceae bacterium]